MCIYIFFPVIHIQLGGPINDICLNIEKPEENGSRSNGKEIIGLGMSLYKVPFSQDLGCKNIHNNDTKIAKKAILAPNTLKIPTTSKIL